MPLSERILRRARHLLRTHRGNVDGYFNGALVGWVTQPGRPDMPLKVGVFTPAGLIAEGLADQFRQDVLNAGIGTGNYGFEITLDQRTLDRIANDGGEVTVQTLGQPVHIIGQHRFDGERAPEKPVTREETKKDELSQFLYSDIEHLAEMLKLDDADYDNPAPLTKHQKLFGRQDYLNGGDLPGNMTTYDEFTRFRLRWDRRIETSDADPESLAHFRQEYLSHYSLARGGLRVPMTRAAIDELNQPVVIGGKKHSLSIATLGFLVDVPPLRQSLDLNNDEWVNWAVFWWAINQSKLLNCEDCLVPQSYIDLLSAVNDEWTEKDFAPSEFMLRMHMENAALKRFDLRRTDGRMSLALSLLLMAARRPDFLRYIPRDTLDALLLPRNSPFTAFVEMISESRLKGVTRAKYARVLRHLGFDLDTLSFTNFTPDGDRLHAAMLPRVPEGDEVDIQMIGPFEKASGLGQATRLSAAVLERTSYSLNSVNFGLDNPAPEGFSRVGALSNYKRAKVNLIHLNAESIPLAFAYQPDVFSDAYNIGYFFWELDTPAACHYLGMDLLDEIWVSTEYGVQVYQPNTDHPVSNVGMSFEDLPDIDGEQARSFVNELFDLNGDEFVFLVVFDSFSFVQRKNPIGTLEAFKRAFPGSENVRLIIKTQNRTRVADPVQIEIWNKMDDLVADDPRIMILDETLTYDDLLLLKKGSDCYVSLHKSEGWGFGMIEAMNLGVPVVCTGYSGNMDFCSDDTAWLVNFEEVELEPDDYIFVRPGQKWAEPDIDHAARQLYAVYEYETLRDERANRALKNVRENFSADAIALRYEERLKKIFANLDHERAQ